MMFRTKANPLDDFLAHRKVMILDGGLATALEARGLDLNDRLWSARVLMESPGAIAQVHLDYLRAGADCITTSSYQASIPGFQERGLSEDEAVRLLNRSTSLALEARDQFWSEIGDDTSRQFPLVAASIGPYGAYLADGSEYTGDYGVPDETIESFHRRRWEILAGSPADILACETIPSRKETEVLLELLRDSPDTWAWMSFSCRDGIRLSDGTHIGEVSRACDAEGGVAAVGINCTSPQYIPSLISEVRRATGKPVLVYPNSGHRYDPASRSWVAGPAPVDLGEASREWYRLGARCIGGCCTVGPDGIAEIRAGLTV